MRRTETRRLRGIAAAVLVGMLALAGCTPAPAEPTPSPTASVATPTPTPTPTGPALIADGSAEDNLPFFTSVMNAVAATEQRAQGRAYIDALVAAGFDKADMEVTQDLTTVGNPVDSLQFSVRWDGECLVGQVGPSIPAPTALVMSQIPGDTCLIGTTRPIDW